MASASRDLGDLVQRGYRFALSLTHDAARAEDLIQDAWFAVLRAKGTWSREYLFATVRNRFIDLYRHERCIETEPLEDHPDDQAVADTNLWPDDEHVFSTNGAFHQALEQLRAEERAVLYLAAVEEYTAQQIADLLNWPRGTVLSMLHRARGKLRRWVRTDKRVTT